MTVSQMSLTNMTDSPQQQMHWMGEQVLNWSGLPVVHVRATTFMEHPFFSLLAPASIAKNGTIRFPFGKGRISPISAYDVARVIVTILKNPKPHIGNVYELTGPRSMDMEDMAKEYEKALDRPVHYVNLPFEEWRDQDLTSLGLPPELFNIKSQEFSTYNFFAKLKNLGRDELAISLAFPASLGMTLNLKFCMLVFLELFFFKNEADL